MNKTSKILAVLLAIAIIGLIVFGVLFNKLAKSTIESGQVHVKVLEAIDRAGYVANLDAEKQKKGELEFKLVKKENTNENISEEN